MPLMRFTKFLQKVRDHRKKQTIRKPRKKNPIKVNDTLHIYELRKIGIATVTKKISKPLFKLTLEEAKKDGFNSVKECVDTICEMHKCSADEIFDVIEYDPHWPKHKIVAIRETD